MWPDHLLERCIAEEGIEVRIMSPVFGWRLASPTRLAQPANSLVELSRQCRESRAPDQCPPLFAGLLLPGNDNLVDGLLYEFGVTASGSEQTEKEKAKLHSLAKAERTIQEPTQSLTAPQGGQDKSEANSTDSRNSRKHEKMIGAIQKTRKKMTARHLLL